MWPPFTAGPAIVVMERAGVGVEVNSIQIHDQALALGHRIYTLTRQS